MKKSNIKKLSLSKETVYNLDSMELNAAKGGMITWTEDCGPSFLSCYFYC